MDFVKNLNYALGVFEVRRAAVLFFSVVIPLAMLAYVLLVNWYRKLIDKMAYKVILKKLVNDELSEAEIEVIKYEQRNWQTYSFTNITSPLSDDLINDAICGLSQTKKANVLMGLFGKDWHNHLQ